ncbi:ATP-binding protein [Nocardioides zeae]|uniref:ATP-binding protein n=1 Tax=Nocardioides imazamoxiresistens TaxID=3231893 RepID=A0ABU3PT85_9ACTN|nr:ATP-binding protein [Nocardioides zeae]MDT9592101.1 ATP-binding protein [Nocardioides zeae]
MRLGSDLQQRPDGVRHEGADQAWVTEDLPHATDAGTRSRHLLRAALGDDGLGLHPALVADVVIVAGELVLNAVDHGAAGPVGTIRLAWRRTTTHVEVSVLDSGSGPSFIGDQTGVHDDEAPRGRGLLMVDAICDAWRVERDPITESTLVTASLPLR